MGLGAWTIRNSAGKCVAKYLKMECAMAIPGYAFDDYFYEKKEGIKRWIFFQKNLLISPFRLAKFLPCKKYDKRMAFLLGKKKAPPKWRGDFYENWIAGSKSLFSSILNILTSFTQVENQGFCLANL